MTGVNKSIATGGLASKCGVFKWVYVDEMDLAVELYVIRMWSI